MVEKVLIETGHAKTAKAYILYRERRARIRETVKVRKQIAGRNNPTDLSLLVDPATRDEIRSWNKGLIALALEKEADVPAQVASEIASAVESRILASGMKRISTSLIRELVDNELFERGLRASLEKQVSIGMPIFDLEQVIFSKSNENSNIASNNPEAINLTIAENTLKQYALKKIFSKDVAEAHLQGMVHLHDLGYPDARVLLLALARVPEEVRPVAAEPGHALGPGQARAHAHRPPEHLPRLDAGVLRRRARRRLHQHPLRAVPRRARRQDDAPGSPAPDLQRIAERLLARRPDAVPRLQRPHRRPALHARHPGDRAGRRGDRPHLRRATRRPPCASPARSSTCGARGDSNGHVFAFPKCDLHVNADSFSDPRQLDLLEYACQAASENGTPYFVFDRDEVTLSACCRLRTTIEDNYMLRHLESMRFCGFQNITVNLPQAAYRAGPGQPRRPLPRD